MRISDWSSDVCSSDLLNAGFAFNSWPLMGDRWFPENVPMLARYWQNLVDNPVVVQFAHRTLAYAVALAALATAWIAARRGAVRNAAELAGMTRLQFALGVATIVYGVEVWLGAAHQGGPGLRGIAWGGVAQRVGRMR